MTTTEKAKGPGYEALMYRQSDIVYELENAYLEGKPVPWPLLKPSFVHEVWSKFSDTGYVDEVALDSIYASMRDNFVRLQISTIVAGHEGVPPEFILESCADQVDEFCAWLIETEEGWRISDYGIRPLADALALAYEAKTPAQRLKYLDRALNVTHMRGDLSKLFIEGGRGPVQCLDEENVH
ncbi:hypothetical protein LC612_36700 [Nostoc sp. CHAB 5834]|nr:hypothetical protein [Nostoc sp. CHAB 5834]